MKNFFETTEFLRDKGVTDCDIGIILGTGLGNMANDIDVELEIDYEDIPHFPISTVESHHGKLIYGRYNGKKILAMKGRFHYYEGYTLKEVTYPVRIMKLLGINYLLISNACGAVNLDFKKGSIMLITDHISMLPDNPLIGENYDELGPRFPDMSQPYSKDLNDKIRNIAKRKSIHLNEGIYLAVSGPSLETRAEYSFMRKIGADVIGMSTIPEVIVANHMSLPCAAISVITDACDPENLEPFDINEIILMAATAEKDMIVIFEELMKEL